MSRLLLAEPVRADAIALLAATLVDLVDLERELKAAHWNVTGASFIALHELFDRVAAETRDAADSVAERIVALGGYADASIGTVSANRLGPAARPMATAGDWLDRTSTLVAAVGGRARSAIDRSVGAGDAVTADLLTGLARDLDKQLWLLEAHLG